MKKKIHILFELAFIMAHLFLIQRAEAMISSSESETNISWSDLANIQDPIKLQQIGLRGMGLLPFGTRIMGSESNSPFKIKDIPEAELFLGGLEEARNYRGLVESEVFLKDLDSLKNENLISNLELISRGSTFKFFLSQELQKIFIEGLKNFKESSAINKENLISLENWKAAAKASVTHYLKYVKQLNITIPKLLLILNVAKEDAPTLMNSMSDVPITFFRSKDDTLLFLVHPELGKVRSIFVPWLDSPSFDISKDIDKLHEIILSAQRLGYAVFVHCHYGVSRSASLVIDYLMAHSSKDTFSEAKGENLFEQVFFGLSALRNEINPNSGFLEFLKKRAREVHDSKF